MTSITRAVIRATGVFLRSDEIVVELQKGVIVARLKGKRTERYLIGYQDLFETLRWRAAKAAAKEKAEQKRGRK